MDRRHKMPPSGTSAPAGRAAAGAGREVAPGRAAGRATAAAPSEDRSIVWPGPGAGSLDDAPGLRTWKTFLHDVQRTRTPRSVTLSSAMRNFD